MSRNTIIYFILYVSVVASIPHSFAFSYTYHSFGGGFYLDFIFSFHFSFQFFSFQLSISSFSFIYYFFSRFPLSISFFCIRCVFKLLFIFHLNLNLYVDLYSWCYNIYNMQVKYKEKNARKRKSHNNIVPKRNRSFCGAHDVAFTYAGCSVHCAAHWNIVHAKTAKTGQQKTTMYLAFNNFFFARLSFFILVCIRQHSPAFTFFFSSLWCLIFSSFFALFYFLNVINDSKWVKFKRLNSFYAFFLFQCVSAFFRVSFHEYNFMALFCVVRCLSITRMLWPFMTRGESIFSLIRKSKHTLCCDEQKNGEKINGKTFLLHITSMQKSMKIKMYDKKNVARTRNVSFFSLFLLNVYINAC